MAQKHKNAAKSAKRQPRASARGSAPRPVVAASTAAGVEVGSSGPAAAAVGAAGVAGAGSTVAAAASTCARLPLGASLSIREVSECAAQLKALFAAGSAEVDAHQLQSIDTAGLQLLLAAAAAAHRRGLKLRLRGAASLSSGAALALGLAEHLSGAAEILP
ncbi:MAG: STAS domain-containing protein [Steroidobacterales bacterium]